MPEFPYLTEIAAILQDFVRDTIEPHYLEVKEGGKSLLSTETKLSDVYLKLVDKLRETKLTSCQMPVCIGCAKSHIDQYILPCEHIVCETCFIEKDQEDNFKLKCPQCQLEYFSNWHNQRGPKNIYSTVNTEARRTQQIDHHLEVARVRELANSNCLDESNCHPDSVRLNTDHSRKSLKPLPPCQSPAQKHWKKHPFNPFPSTNLYQVVNRLRDPQECQESGNHVSKLFPHIPAEEERESDSAGLSVENTELLGHRKKKC